MSLYNKIFGENEDATALLGMINCTRDEFMRYRDVELVKKGTRIRVITRIGGDNRKDYRQVFNDMRRNPLYVRNYDDDFDNTYCYFEFNIPDKYKHACETMAPKEEPISVGMKFQKEVEESNDPNSAAAKRMQAIADEIFGRMENGEHLIGL